MAHKASAEPASATRPDTYEAKAIALLQSKDFWSIPLEESIQKIGSKGVSDYTVEEAESILMNAKEAADSEQSGVATLAHLRGPGTNGPGAWAPRPGSRARRTPKPAPHRGAAPGRRRTASNRLQGSKEDGYANLPGSVTSVRGRVSQASAARSLQRVPNSSRSQFLHPTSQQDVQEGDQRESQRFFTHSRENKRSVFRRTSLQLLPQRALTDREEGLPMPYAGKPCTALRRNMPEAGLERVPQTRVPFQGLQKEAACAADR